MYCRSVWIPEWLPVEGFPSKIGRMSLGRRLTFWTVLEFELVLTMLELGVAPCEGELLPNSADCGGCVTAIALVDCTACSVADCEGCVAMIPLGGCVFCSVGCEVSSNVFARQICSAIVHCNSSDSRISSSMRSAISVSNWDNFCRFCSSCSMWIAIVAGFRQNTDPRSTDPLMTHYWRPIKSMEKWKL